MTKVINGTAKHLFVFRNNTLVDSIFKSYWILNPNAQATLHMSQIINEFADTQDHPKPITTEKTTVKQRLFPKNLLNKGFFLSTNGSCTFNTIFLCFTQTCYHITYTHTKTLVLRHGMCHSKWNSTHCGPQKGRFDWGRFRNVPTSGFPSLPFRFVILPRRCWFLVRLRHHHPTTLHHPGYDRKQRCRAATNLDLVRSRIVN